MYYYLTEMPSNDTVYKESKVFNVTGTLALDLPDSIYTCYIIPNVTYDAWTGHYKQFSDLYDF
jgi:hypothetical protein